MITLRRQPRDGLVPMHCAVIACGRYLDLAQPEFLAKHPAPRCPACLTAGRPAPAVMGAITEGESS